MLIVKLPTSCSCLFWAGAMILSAFQAFVGFRYGLYICTAAHKDDDYKPKDDSSYRPRPPKPPNYVRWFAYGGHHALLYFVCSLSGFLAWYLALRVSSEVVSWTEISSGTGAVLVALSVLAVLGVSGALARILYLGKLPR
jgi:hypothetical protein